MALTDQSVLGEIQVHLLEPNDSGATWPSGLWATDEVLALVNQRQYDFLKRTALILTRATIPTIPQEHRQALPSDWIMTQRVVWLDGSGNFTEIPRSDGWEADHAIPTWPNTTATQPALYTDGESQTLTLEIMPAASQPGSLQILYVALSTQLTGAGVTFTVPDEFVPAIKWGVIADMLGKVGRAFDPQRAQYAESRYEEGVQAAKIMLAGWP